MNDSIVVDVVRVFTDQQGRFGNELGIVQLTDASRGWEQRIATQLGFSETVFIESLDERGARIRIFTPAQELPFAGHPSVGTAWWLASQGTPVEVLRERAGDVAVQYEDDVTWIAGRAAWAPEFEVTRLDTPAEVDELDPGAFHHGHHYLYAWIDEATGLLRSRMFAPDMGIREDEATGAAAVRITALLDCDLEILQGHGSRLLTRRTAGDDILVGGRTVFDRQFTL
jgi:predicted PhzF superfamily epimerase YddE/YHI9